MHINLAVRASNFGLGSGGTLVLVNLKSKVFNNIKTVEREGHILIQATLGHEKESVFLLPVYLSFRNWDVEFERLLCFLSNINSYIKNLILLGDLNGRIGNGQNIYNDVIFDGIDNIHADRQSKDLVTNHKGTKVLELMDSLGLIVLNGRTDGDRKGEFTFIGHMGSSVIDLVADSVNCLYFVNDLKVLSYAGSDHLPVDVSLKIRVPGAGALAGEEGRGNTIALLPQIKMGRRR